MDSLEKLSKGSREHASVSPDIEAKSNVATASTIGPALPPGFISARSSGETIDIDYSGSSSDSEAQFIAEQDAAASAYGPALPPGFSMSPPEKPVIGASLPPGMTKDSFKNLVGDDDSSSSEGQELIGPLPPTSVNTSATDAYTDFERRALKMKQKLTSGPDEELKREEWMTVLPPELGKNFGFGPRNFLRKTPRAAGDRSVWTDTPTQRIEKELSGNVEDDEGKPSGSSKDELQDLIQYNYDEKMSKKAEELNKTGKRAKSLMEIHQKNIKRKKKEEQSKPKERKPFDRDADLKVNMIDDAKRKALVKQSAQLNDKFSHGKGQFL